MDKAMINRDAATLCGLTVFGTARELEWDFPDDSVIVADESRAFPFDIFPDGDSDAALCRERVRRVLAEQYGLSILIVNCPEKRRWMPAYVCRGRLQGSYPMFESEIDAIASAVERKAAFQRAMEKAGVPMSRRISQAEFEQHLALAEFDTSKTLKI